MEPAAVAALIREELAKSKLAIDVRALQSLLSVPASARVYNSGAISIVSAGAGTFLTFDSEHFDNGGLHSTTSNTGRLTAPVAGSYLIGASVEFAASAVGTIRQLALRVNGATFIAVQGVPPLGGGTATQVSVVSVYPLSAGDYVEARCFQDSAGALNVSALGNYSPEFWMARLPS